MKNKIHLLRTLNPQHENRENAKNHKPASGIYLKNFSSALFVINPAELLEDPRGPRFRQRYLPARDDCPCVRPRCAYHAPDRHCWLCQKRCESNGGATERREGG